MCNLQFGRGVSRGVTKLRKAERGSPMILQFGRGVSRGVTLAHFLAGVRRESPSIRPRGEPRSNCGDQDNTPCHTITFNSAAG